MTEKICSKCKKTKNLSEFWYVFDKRAKVHKWSYRSYCKQCQTNYRRKYRQMHPEEERLKKIKFKFMSPFKYRYGYYKISCAKNRGLKFELTLDEFSILVKQPCYYCGEIGSDLTIDGLNGLDRLNPNEGYVLENIVSCCYPCNRMKSNLSQYDFLEKCKTIVEYSKSKLLESMGVK